MDLTYFNPNSQKEEDFIASFVARQETLAFFLKQLGLTQPGQAPRHHLIVAPRGFGKTSLLRRIAIGVRADASLYQRFIPLRFREEQHNVISLDVLWRNCLQSLLEAREDEAAPQSELGALDAAWEAHAPRQALPREEQDGEPAWHTLREYCDALQRRPVLLIDNLDTLLAGLSTQHQWGLRKRLQADDGPVLIAAASRYPEATHDPQAAFFEFFRIQPLDRLTNQDVFTCLRNIATHRGAAGQQVLHLLDTEPGRIAALNTMAGGNPRTLSVLYGVLESHMSGDVLSQLSAMLDTFTGWYQARTEELPMQARAVFDALALNWDPMTAAALGLATGLDTTAVSSQLSRLEKSGYVEAVALSRRKTGRSGFQVSERFFNIWYLMRNGPRRAKQSIRFLTTFLQSCFSTNERMNMARAALNDKAIDLSYVLALATGIGNKRMQGTLLNHAHEISNQPGKPEEFKALVNELRSEWGIGEPLRHVRPEETISKRPHKQSTKAPRKPTSQRASNQICNHEAARALINKGADLGYSERAIQVYDEVVERFGAARDLAIRKPVAHALINKGVTLSELGRAEQAIDVYNEVVARFGAAGDAALRESVARAMVNKGATLGELGRSEQAIGVYDEVVASFGAAGEATLREPVAMALVNKAMTLGALGRAEQEIEVYDELLARFGAATETGLYEPVSVALFNKGFRLGALGRSEQMIEVYDELLARFGAADEAALRERVAAALLCKGDRLGALGRTEQEIEVYDELVARFGTAGEAKLREVVAIALVSKGERLEKMRSIDAAELAYRAAVERQPSNGAMRSMLGNLLLDHKADIHGAKNVYESGLVEATELGHKVMLHANLSYLFALSRDDARSAQQHLTFALGAESNLSAAGKFLLEALSGPAALPTWNWPLVFAAIGKAVASEDGALWTDHADDLERLLWHILNKGQGADFKQWMEAAGYPTQYAPLYHAFVAGLEGEDHLLQINPETREPASKIYAGIARRLKLFGTEGQRKHPKVRAK
jgi:tetratricopeptide (TPR) repeat protein